MKAIKGWHDQMIDVLSLDGVVLTDIDDRTNRLTVGVQDLAATQPAVLAELTRLGIPNDAVQIKEQSPIGYTSSVADGHRPVVGGLQIEFQVGAFGLFTAACTVGFVSDRLGKRGFVTNSHCSRTQGEVDNGRYWQHERPVTEGGQVGEETKDLAYTNPFNDEPCPSGRVCRKSDSNYVDQNPDEGMAKGKIARTALNSLTWNGTNQYRVSSTASPTSGTVNKVGRTTGRTAGAINHVCANVNVADSNITLLCQNSANAAVDFGDSGSPVFTITNSPNTNDVSIVGILWGQNEAQTTFFYSRIGNIKNEIAGLQVCAVGTC